MLLILEDSLIFSGKTLTEKEEDSFANLALAGREGKHLIIGSLRLLRYLASSNFLGRREKAFFAQSIELYTRNWAMFGVVNICARIVKEGDVHREIVGGRTELVIPLEKFSRIDSVAETTMVAEDLTDCKALAVFAKARAKLRGVGAPRVAFDMKPGGGANTGKVFVDGLSGNRIFYICVLDSDRYFPDAPLGETARKAAELFEEYNYPCAELHVLGCRELENLIPDEIYEELSDSSDDRMNTLDLLASLADEGLNTARVFVDIKEGVQLGKILRHWSIKECRETWGAFFDSIEKSKPKCFSEDPFTCLAMKACKNRDSCECRVAIPNRTPILDRAPALIPKHQKTFWKSMPTELRNVFEESADFVFDWGCAGPPTVTV